MEKVKLTNEQFDTVKSYLESYSKENLVQNVVTQEFSAQNPLYQIPFESLMIAIYRPEDITIEQTVDEKLLECFNGVHGDWHKKGMRDALDIIGMKVKGIND